MIEQLHRDQQQTHAAARAGLHAFIYQMHGIDLAQPFQREGGSRAVPQQTFQSVVLVGLDAHGGLDFSDRERIQSAGRVKNYASHRIGIKHTIDEAMIVSNVRPRIHFLGTREVIFAPCTIKDSVLKKLLKKKYQKNTPRLSIRGFFALIFW